MLTGLGLRFGHCYYGGNPMSTRQILILTTVLSGASLKAAGEERRFPQEEIPPFWKGRVEDIEAKVASVKKGNVQVIARSPGGRPVNLVIYGPRSNFERQANYNSAVAAGDPGYYARKGEDVPPIVFLVGPPHGHEVEGMVGLVNLIHVAETGKDLRGKAWPELLEYLNRSRVLIVPLSNPDGRARCPYDSFVGIPVQEMTRIGQGTAKDGSLYGWPGAKRRHPMKDDVGFLGAYFNNDGINPMHDEFFSPMAEETKALLRVAREEAPDYILNLHSHGSAPAILPTSYVPHSTKVSAARFAERLMKRYREAGLPAGRPPQIFEDGTKFPPPSFNLTSALHHVCGGVSTLFECPHGLKEPQYPDVTHEQILDLELMLFEELLAFALESPRPRMAGDPRPIPVKAGWTDRVPLGKGAREFFVDAAGRPENSGTRKAPWDLATALSGKKAVSPGSIIWIRGGTYRGTFEVKLSGKEGMPIHVRAYPDERATILDSGLTIVEPASFIWIWDLEIAGSVPVEKRETQQTGSHPTDLPGTGGLNVYAGEGCKFINLYIHDNVLGGASWWVGSTDSEMHGCIIHSNGWRAPDRGHGHCIYTQNREGVKVISGCIFSVPYDGSYTMHAYGSSRAYIDNFLLQDNIAYEKGPFLIGGGRPSRNIKVFRNSLYDVDLRLGYGAENEDCEVRGNVIARGKLTIQKFQKVVEENNLEELPGQLVVLIPNAYDPSRAYIAIYNGAKAREVKVDVAPFLKSGDRYSLLDPKDLFGKPILQGTCKEKTITVPMEGEFAPFVVLKSWKFSGE